MNEEKILIECEIDYFHAIERFAGNTLLYHKYLFKFLDEDAYKRLQADMASCDYTAAERSVHSLKGISGNLGIVKVYEQSVALLEAIRANEIDNAKMIYEKLRKEYDTACSAISSFKDS